MTNTDPVRGKFGNASGKDGGTAGSFTDHAHTAPEPAAELRPVPRLRVAALEPSTHVPETLDVPQRLLQEEWRITLAGLDSGPGGASDLLVGSIMDGRLSRGTPGAAGAAALSSWRIDAKNRFAATGDIRYAEFELGVQVAASSMFKGKIKSQLDPTGMNSEQMRSRLAEKAAITKRASVGDRETWQYYVKTAETEGQRRGMLVAGAALSGTDSWWGFRDDVDRTMLGE